MLTYEIKESQLDRIKPLDEDMVSEEIEGIISEFELLISKKTTLNTKKGSVHWHVKKPNEKGVLEITYWPKKARLWIDIHNNRQKDWNLAIIKPIADRFTKEFGGRVERVSE